MTTPFSPAIFRSDKTLETYLSGKETIDSIKARAKNTYGKRLNQWNALEVTWLAVTSPFKVVIALFIRAAGELSIYSFGASKEGQKLLAQANYLAHDSVRWIDAVRYGENLLASTINVLSPDQAQEIYTHAPVSVAKLPKSLQTRFHFFIRNGQLHFDKHGGQCVGLSDWFAHLYFRTKANFKDPEHHLTNVTSMLQNGAGKEAALLELGQVDTTPLLGLKKRQIGPLVVNATAEKVATVFQRLKPGLYAIGTQTHRMNFYKGKSCHYLFEPASGLIALRSTKELEDWSRVHLANNSTFKICQLSHRMF